MSLARDFANFADAANAELDGIVNEMAEKATKAELEEVRSEKNELLERIFTTLGGIEEKLARVVPAVESFDRRLTLLQEAQIDTARDHARRLTKLENHGIHPDEEVTPRYPRPPLPR